MKFVNLITAIAGLIIALGVAGAHAQGKTVSYMDGETTLEGYWSASECEESNAPIVLISYNYFLLLLSYYIIYYKTILI